MVTIRLIFNIQLTFKLIITNIMKKKAQFKVEAI